MRMHDKVRALTWVTAGAATLVLVSPLKVLWARPLLSWIAPFVLWGVIIACGAALARTREPR
jgi:hypothetical protein